MDLKIGVTLGCIVAAIIALVVMVSSFNRLENRLANLEVRKTEDAKRVEPTQARPVQTATADGQPISIIPVVVNVTAKDLACLKLTDALGAAPEENQWRIAKQMEDLSCFDEPVPRPVVVARPTPAATPQQEAAKSSSLLSR